MGLRLAYIGIEASRLDKWQDFGDLIGLQTIPSPEALFMRMDEKARRLILTEGSADDHVFSGFEVESVDEFARAVERLKRADIAFTEGDDVGAELRAVERYVAFHDPEGLRHEIAYGCKDADAPFAPAIATRGFVTGDEGLGHVAINAKDYATCEKFMAAALGAGLSDHIFSDFGDSKVAATFMHLNPRHHSIAYAQFPFETPKKIDHVMIESVDLVDVLKAQERVREADIPITITLGEHPNDRAISFYCTTPSGFRIEMAANCIKVKPGEWEPTSYDFFSMWGHRVQA
jgi:2,3-dihydroxybiphenyl 1,2-dioxygenase